MGAPLQSEPFAQSESRLRRMADTLPAYIAYVDHDLRYVMANRMYEIQFNKTTEQVVGCKVEDVVGPAFTMMKPHLEACLSGIPQKLEPHVQTTQGPRVLRVTHTPDFDAEGHVRGAIIHGYDITDQHRAEQALIQSEKLAAVGRLASSIAHEINNPLESVVNLLYLIELTARDDPAQGIVYAQLAQQELARVSQIATQTLRFFKQSTAAAAADLGDTIDAVLSLHLGRLTNSRIEVQRRVRSAGSVLCFEGEIRQVLNNLIGNAIDAMRSEGGRLLVRARPAYDQASGRAGFRMTIADTGYGMDKATAEKVFDAFFTTKGIMGTGLGLWISQGIVKKHGGRLSVRSSQNPAHHGTVFALFLPETETAT